MAQLKNVTHTHTHQNSYRNLATYASLAPPLRRTGEGERAEESGDTAIQSVALSTGLSVPIKLLHTRGNNFVM